MVISHYHDAVMKNIGDEFKINGNEYGDTKRYLGAGLAWRMRINHYVKAVVQIVKDLLTEDYKGALNVWI